MQKAAANLEKIKAEFVKINQAFEHNPFLRNLLASKANNQVDLSLYSNDPWIARYIQNNTKLTIQINQIKRGKLLGKENTDSVIEDLCQQATRDTKNNYPQQIQQTFNFAMNHVRNNADKFKKDIDDAYNRRVYGPAGKTGYKDAYLTSAAFCVIGFGLVTLAITAAIHLVDKLILTLRKHLADQSVKKAEKEHNQNYFSDPSRAVQISIFQATKIKRKHMDIEDVSPKRDHSFTK